MTRSTSGWSYSNYDQGGLTLLFERNDAMHIVARSTTIPFNLQYYVHRVHCTLYNRHGALQLWHRKPETSGTLHEMMLI